jgi:hypothetical protein
MTIRNCSSNVRTIEGDVFICLRTAVVLGLALFLPACEVVGDVFQAGFWAGFIIVLVIGALVAWFLQRHKS